MLRIFDQPIVVVGLLVIVAALVLTVRAIARGVSRRRQRDQRLARIEAKLDQQQR